MKLFFRGERTIIADPDQILSKKVPDENGQPTGKIVPESVIELKEAYGEKLLKMYPKEFLLVEESKEKKPKDPVKQE